MILMIVTKKVQHTKLKQSKLNVYIFILKTSELLEIKRHKKVLFFRVRKFPSEIRKTFFRKNLDVFQASGQKLPFPKGKGKIFKEKIFKKINLRAKKFHFLKYKKNFF